MGECLVKRLRGIPRCLSFLDQKIEGVSKTKRFNIYHLFICSCLPIQRKRNLFSVYLGLFKLGSGCFHPKCHAEIRTGFLLLMEAQERRRLPLEASKPCHSHCSSICFVSRHINSFVCSITVNVLRTGASPMPWRPAGRSIWLCRGTWCAPASFRV